ncbi:alpha-amylase family glycosyl hydrolase [Simiduia curdlanivorans]|uniref:Alpha-amylase n=1 Tax=Simiduia curdlanivorans TaxID=1492769 RepID=A0ABV8V4G6_9GAMM|nr:alpha amylase C-terminal domain-containing protein [Simiduia curdlanivorans]MDN3641036.1 alpha-amylase family glycosyl hydrolase [Simiduia curdlanivorans]
MKLTKRCLTAASLGLALGCASLSASAGTAFVHLFEWKWNDIATECEVNLGPKGFDAVQISPPHEHTAGPYWWTRYQPVSFTNLTSRSGTEAELQSMINRCHAAGVKIYADVVMNNWASYQDHGNIASGGDSWSPRNYPDLSSQDFHNDCTISNYGDANNVWDCGLYGMPDLHTGRSNSQDYVANYLKKLTAMGVDGFRIDAAKHIRPSELDTVMAKANRPWSFLEVIGASGEAVQPTQYTYIAPVTEFGYGTAVAGNFNGQIKNLKTLGTSWGLLPSDKAIVFIDNHDRERGHGGGGNLTYKEGVKYNLANIYMLAFPYGYPKVMSGYKFTDTDAGPPAGNTNCDNAQWVCQHRWANIANMVGFRNFTVGAWSVNNWWDNGNNQIAFGRGDKGFVVINNESGALQQTLQTGLPAGDYCNILAGAAECSGPMITVAANGMATFNVAGNAAAAIHGGAKGTGCTTNCPLAKVFPQLNVRGTFNGWSNKAMTLVANNTWETTITLTGGSSQRLKLDVYGDWSQNYGDTNSDGILERTGADIYNAGSGDYKLTVNDQTLAYSLVKVGQCTTCYTSVLPTLSFRGTANGWSTSAMSLVANNTWEVTVSFDGQSNQRFKFDVKGDWSQNYGDNNADFVLEQTGADIFTNVIGSYKVRVNDQSMTYSLTAQ